MSNAIFLTPMTNTWNSKTVTTDQKSATGQ